MGKKFVRTETGFVLVEEPDTPEHFFLMGEAERKLVADWHKIQKAETYGQKYFLKYIKKSIRAIKYDYSIATIEPSLSEDGQIFYEKGREVLVGLSYNQWEEKAKQFMPEKASDLATLYELYLWYAYRLAKGYWTMHYICNDSSGAGNYKDAPNATNDFDLSGAKVVGGFLDGVGNTSKIVKDKKEKHFVICGGCYGSLGDAFTVAERMHWRNVVARHNWASGCLVLRK